jgi:hypothetical protein
VDTLLTGGNSGEQVPKLENTFTKTIGLSSDSFGIFQVALDTNDFPYYNNAGKADWRKEMGIFISMLQVNHNNPNPTVSIRQYITHEDLKELSMLLWHAERAYESRKKEAQEGNQGEAANETPA